MLLLPPAPMPQADARLPLAGCIPNPDTTALPVWRRPAGSVYNRQPYVGAEKGKLTMSQLNPEELYFQEKEAQLRKKIREDLEAKAKVAARRQAIASQLGGNEPLAQRLHDLGFDADTVPALHLLPLVAVAWADDKVTARERQAVLQVAKLHNIQPGSRAWLLLESVLEQRLDPEVGRQVLHMVHDLLAARGLHPQSLVEACLDVASASGGVLGLGNKVSPQERALIESLASHVDPRVVDKLVQKLQ